jgi:NAD(P)H dehydrogenase (quinone)
MHIYVIYTHPSKRSFSARILEAFTRGLQEAGHSYEVADLYEMCFQSEMDEEQYLRETSGDPSLPVPADVKEEHDKINRAQGLAFIYPVWWSDCPAKLKGWFDRVLTCGYAYFYDEKGSRGTSIGIRKAMVLCSAGHTSEHLEKIGIAESMRRIMLTDRLLGIGVAEAHLEILGGMMPNDETYIGENLQKAFELGKKYNEVR